MILNEGLESIGNDAFIFSSIEEVVFPSSLKTIGSYAFYKCLFLKVVDLSKTQLTIINDNAFSSGGITQLQLPITLVEIAVQAFMETDSLVSLEIPEGVKSIGLEAFRESGLSTLKLPNSISFIASRAFYYCSNLREVRTYGAVADPLLNAIMDVSCFEGAKALTTFEIPQSIKKISRVIFSNHTNLASITIPAGINYIGFKAFGNALISNVIVEAVLPPAVGQVAEYWYGFSDEVQTITVPSGSVDAYKTANGWKDFSTKIK